MPLGWTSWLERGSFDFFLRKVLLTKELRISLFAINYDSVLIAVLTADYVMPESFSALKTSLIDLGRKTPLRIEYSLFIVSKSCDQALSTTLAS